MGLTYWTAGSGILMETVFRETATGTDQAVRPQVALMVTVTILHRAVSGFGGWNTGGSCCQTCA